MSTALSNFLKSIFATLALTLAFGQAVQAGEEQRIAALINAKEWEPAQQALNQWRPSDPNAKLFMQYHLENSKDPELAIIRLQEFLLKAPHYPEAYNNLALHLIRQGEYKQASDWLSKGIATDDRYRRLHDNLSKLYAMMASQAYQKALGKAPGQIKASDFAQFDYLQPIDGSPAQVATAPAATLVTPPAAISNPAEQQKQLVTQLQNWAEAWSSQKVGNYLSFYSLNFQPSDGLSLADWRQQRKERVNAPRFIRVTVSKPDVTLFGDGSIASVRFIQHYRSNAFDDTIVKFMIWGLQQGQWRILQEETGV